MPFETLLFEVSDEIATVTLNRPAKLNAWTPVMGAELLEAFERIEADPEIRVAVLTGAGERAFCAGADMDFFAAQIREGGGMQGAGGRSRVEDFPRRLRTLSKPVIAALNGYALGVGATLALLCDVRLAADDARIGFLFGRMGVMAELGSTWLLPRIVGTARACELMLSGRMVEGGEAERMGLVNRAVPRAELRAAVESLAGEMRKCAPLSLRHTREAIYRGFESTFEDQVRHEAVVLDALYRTTDHAEAVAAFRERRPPRFHGR